MVTGIIFICFCIYLVHLLLKEKEGQCVLIFANIRTGKTTLLSRYAQKELKLIKKGKSKYKYVISNTPISGCMFVKDIRKLLQETMPEYALILVDEAGSIWNNRKMNMTMAEIEYVKLIGHYRSKIVVLSQSYDDIDITLRRIYTTMYLLNKIGSLTLIRPIKKFITIEPETSQIIDGYKFRFFLSYCILYRPRYYQYFDTYYKPYGCIEPEYDKFETIKYRTKIKNNKIVTEKIIEVNNQQAPDENKEILIPDIKFEINV